MRWESRWQVLGLGFGAAIGALMPAVVVLATALSGELVHDGFVQLLIALGTVTTVFGIPGAVIGAVIGGLVGVVLAGVMPHAHGASRRWVAPAVTLLAGVGVVVGAAAISQWGSISVRDAFSGSFSETLVWWIPLVAGAGVAAWLAPRIGPRSRRSAPAGSGAVDAP